MNDYERLIDAYPLYHERLLEKGWDAAEIGRDSLIATVLIFGLGAAIGSDSPTVRVAGAVSALSGLIDRLLWVIGLGSVIEWFTG